MREPVFVIAEAGVNHNGSLETALQLVKAAAAAQADAVKFQTFHAEALASALAPKAAYQAERTGVGSQLEMLRALELTEEDHRAILAACAKANIEFLSAPFDPDSAELLRSLGLQTIKLPSGAITDLPLLRAVGAMGCRVILSTGMSDLAEVDSAIRALEAAGTPRGRMIVLQCTTAYPAPPESANLRAMVTMQQEFGVSVGYSDHTEGMVTALAAVALGAAVVEKHLTLDRSMPGPDHAASMEPAEFGELVRRVRTVSAALGDGVKAPSSTELNNRDAARTSIVAARPIAAGTTIVEADLAAKRPGSGVSPMRWDEVVGMRATRDYAPDEGIELP